MAGFIRRIALIATAAFALRIGIRAVVGTGDYWTAGYANYLVLAQSIASGRGYAFDGIATAYRVPLYPLFVWAVTGGRESMAWALIVAQAALSTGTVVLCGLVGRRLAGPRAGIAAAMLYALWPYAAWHDLSLQESGLFAFLALAATWLVLLARERGTAENAMAAGVAIGAAMLTRATLLLYAAGVLAWLALPGRPPSGDAAPARPWIAAVMAMAALALTLAPWLAYQQRMTGQAGLGTEAGAALYAGNHPLTFAALPPADRTALSAMSESEADAYLGARGREAILADPVRFLLGAGRKLWAAFGPWPSPRHGRLVDLAYMAGWLPFFGLRLAGMVLRRGHWRVDLPLWWHFPGFVLTTSLFWAHTAHRSYLDPVIAIFGGVALARILPRSHRPASQGATSRATPAMSCREG